MLRWMWSFTKLDRIRIERISGTTKVGKISNKVLARRLKYLHVMRRYERYVGRRAMGMEVGGRRREQGYIRKDG